MDRGANSFPDISTEKSEQLVVELMTDVRYNLSTLSSALAHKCTQIGLLREAVQTFFFLTLTSVKPMFHLHFY